MFIFLAPGYALGQVIDGDREGAERTMKNLGDTLENVAESTPVIGHLIAAGYAIAGN